MEVLLLMPKCPGSPDDLWGDRAVQWLGALREAGVGAHVVAFDSSQVSHRDVEVARSLCRSLQLFNPPRFGALRGVAAYLRNRAYSVTRYQCDAMTRQVRQLIADQHIEAVICCGTVMSQFVPASAGFYVLDLAESDSAMAHARGKGCVGVRRWIHYGEAAALRQFEERQIAKADVTLVTGRAEAELLGSRLRHQRVLPVVTGVTVGPLPAEQAYARRPPVVLFRGGAEPEANRRAAQWFATSVWPALRRGRPDATLLIECPDPSRLVRDLAARDRSIRLIPRVDVHPSAGGEAAVCVMPMTNGRGSEHAVLDAMARAIPVVASPYVAASLDKCFAEQLVVADTSDAWRSAVDPLLNDRPKAWAVARACHAAVAEFGTWQAQWRPVMDLLLGTARHDEHDSPPAAPARKQSAQPARAGVNAA